ncbi:hypothetical protein PISMIDRAFT_634453 [Pisolithus microcarpus 441]|uniref:Saccharopine dehydrogenase-like C-terminal domain-containing protein n=1 Tax=Pisolithus microcarpus 441 TaxID=765257 RepID=A0A0C9XXZ5_9AGAM|nr:hypothetical protein PISMIDRAFT_634453 [Pisolithus microcarpus 441]
MWAPVFDPDMASITCKKVPGYLSFASIAGLGKTMCRIIDYCYVSPVMRELDEEAKRARIVVMNGIGLDPSINHLYAVKSITEVHEKGKKYPSQGRQVDITGWLDATEKEGLTENLTWAEVTQRAISANDASERFPDQSESTWIISGFHWIGLLSSEKVKPRGKNLLDMLCAQLQTLMKYETGKCDLVMLQHKFVMEWRDGTQQILTSTLEKYGRSGGHFAMAVTVGVPCSIAAQQVLDGIINILEFLHHTRRNFVNRSGPLWRAKDWVLNQVSVDWETVYIIIFSNKFA